MPVKPMSSKPMFSHEQNDNLPPAIAGFENIKRYWDPRIDSYTAKILPGEFYVSRKAETVTTVLGSCISACVRDKMSGVGGMNHFMLPVQDKHADKAMISDAARYGNWAMEYLINCILKNGGKRHNLEAKIFGGGRVLAGMTSIDVGARNAKFVKEYLIKEAIDLIAEDVGDVCPRKVLYYTDSGKVKLKRMNTSNTEKLIKRETVYSTSIVKDEPVGDIDLF